MLREPVFAGSHSSVPEWVFEHAARIRVLDATHNRLTELPPDRWSLFILLSKFHIAHNQLHVMPASLCLAVRALNPKPKPHPQGGAVCSSSGW